MPFSSIWRGRFSIPYILWMKQKEAETIFFLKIPGLFFTSKSITVDLKNGGFKFPCLIFQSI